MALVNTDFSLNIVALDKIDHIFFKETLKKKLERIGMNQSQRGYNHDRVCHLLYRSQNDLKLERISTNQSSMDLNHDGVSLVEFLQSPCVELK